MMSSSITPWKTVPQVGDYGRPARMTWRDVDWAGYEHDLTVAGSRLHYLDYAAGHYRGGDIFVLAHGLGGRWQHWLENIPALAQRGRVIAVDLPGFGRSRPLPGQYSIDRFAETLGRRHLGRNLRHHPRTVASTYFEVLTAALPAPGVLRRQINRRPALRQLLLWPYLHRPAALPADSVALLLDGAGARGVFPTSLAVGRLRPGEGFARSAARSWRSAPTTTRSLRCPT